MTLGLNLIDNFNQSTKDVNLIVSIKITLKNELDGTKNHKIVPTQNGPFHVTKGRL